jgi:hypothetical protein
MVILITNWQKHCIFLIIAYVFSSTKLVLPGSEEGWRGAGEGGGGGRGEKCSKQYMYI